MTHPDDTMAPPGYPGGAIPRALYLAALVLAVVGGLGTLGIMAIINLDVVGRGAFGTPVPATAEIVAATIVTIVFLQLPHATAAGRNIRSDMLLGRLRKTRPGAAAWLDAFHHLAGTVMLGILLRYLWPEIMSSIEGHETVGLHGVFTIPRWPFVTAVLLGCALTFVQFLLLTAGMIARAVRGVPA